MQKKCVGLVVKSVAGRDKDRFFVVYSFNDGDFVYLVDGDLRKLDKPKRKRWKHVRATDVVLALFSDRNEIRPLYDAHIRKALKDAGFIGNAERTCPNRMSSR